MDFVLRTERFDDVEGTIRARETDLQVPALCDVEAAAALRRGLLLGAVSLPRAEEAVQDYRDLPLTRHGHELLLERMLELRNNFSAYDAVYVALAEHLGAPLLTTDDRLARAARDDLEIATLP